MCAVIPFTKLIGVDAQKLAKEEFYLLELELLIRICEKLKEELRNEYKNYFQIFHLTTKKENKMLETDLIPFIIKDILSTKEYDLKGIALYANTFEDVLEEILIGVNKNPSAIFLRRILELHRTVRRDLYSNIIRKIKDEYFFQESY